MVRAAQRIVKCPKCDVLLQEPPPGTPLYECGGCSATLLSQERKAVSISNDFQHRQPGEDVPSHGCSSPSLSSVPIPYYGAPPPPAHKQGDSYTDPAYARSAADQVAQSPAHAYSSSYAKFCKNSDRPLPVRHCHPPDLECPHAPLPTLARATSGPRHPSSSHSSVPALSRSGKPPGVGDPVLLPMSVLDSNEFDIFKPALGCDSVGYKAYDGQPVEAVKQVVGHEYTPQMGPQKNLRWKPKADQSAARLSEIPLASTATDHRENHDNRSRSTTGGPLDDAEQIHGLGLEFRCDPGLGHDMYKGLDMYEVPAEVGDFEPIEYSSSVSEAEGNRIGDMETSRNSAELAAGTAVDQNMLAQDTQRAHCDSPVATSPFGGRQVGLRDQPTHEPVPQNLIRQSFHLGKVGYVQSREVQEGVVPYVSNEHVSPHQKAEHIQVEPEASVAMPSDLFCRASPGFSTTRGQKIASSQEERTSGTGICNHSMPAAKFQEQQVNQACAEPLACGLTNDVVLRQQEAQAKAPGPKGIRSAAAYSYKLLAIQPSKDSDWSRRTYAEVLQISQNAAEGPLHEQQTQKCKLYPLFPTTHDPPYVVCQHCLQLLVLPLNLPLLTRNIQKLRCSGCMQISLFTVELTIGTGASFGDLTDNNYQHDSRVRAQVPSDVMEKLSGGGGRNATVYSPSKVLSTSSLSDTGVEYVRLKPTSEVSVALVRPVPLPSPLSYAASDSSSTATSLLTSQSKGKDMFEQVRESVDKPRSEQGPELLDDPGGVSSVHGGSDSESESARNGSLLGNSTIHPPLDDLSGSNDEHDSHFSYPSSSTTVQDGLKGRNKVVSIFKGLKEFTKTGQGKIYRRQVYVNSRAIPDPLVKKAEEYAGPIHPGHYWYDVHAGFWGVMGGPCKGIVPPFIEELNHPLPRDCSGGKTGVLVNGRELHTQDLEILSKRGLPRASGMSYRVEIDGRVTEENSGQELKSLGRLAPSVEKRGRGHGMVVK